MHNNIKLLVSPKNITEAKICVDAGADYVDCKNPDEGSLGANFPWIIKEMKKIIPSNNGQKLSATIGDFPNLPGSASLAALGAVCSGADVIKVGLKGPKTEEEGTFLMEKVVKATKTYNQNIKVVAAGYADYSRMKNGLHFLKIPLIAAKSGADIAMLDTYIKDGKNIFDFLNIDDLNKFRNLSQKYNLEIALAGKLQIDDMNKIKKIHPDIIGVRSAVCEGFDRNKGMMKYDLITKLKKKLIAT
jgi:hypothetical protein